jgi:hypothetical protein
VAHAAEMGVRTALLGHALNADLRDRRLSKAKQQYEGGEQDLGKPQTHHWDPSLG